MERSSRVFLFFFFLLPSILAISRRNRSLCFFRSIRTRRGIEIEADEKLSRFILGRTFSVRCRRENETGVESGGGRKKLCETFRGWFSSSRTAGGRDERRVQGPGSESPSTTTTTTNTMTTTFREISFLNRITSLRPVHCCC